MRYSFKTQLAFSLETTRELKPTAEAMFCPEHLTKPCCNVPVRKMHSESQLGKAGTYFPSEQVFSLSPWARGLRSKRENRIKYGGDRKSKGENLWKLGSRKCSPLFILSLGPSQTDVGEFAFLSDHL